MQCRLTKTRCITTFTHPSTITMNALRYFVIDTITCTTISAIRRTFPLFTSQPLPAIFTLACSHYLKITSIKHIYIYIYLPIQINKWVKCYNINYNLRLIS